MVNINIPEIVNPIYLTMVIYKAKPTTHANKFTNPVPLGKILAKLVLSLLSLTDLTIFAIARKIMNPLVHNGNNPGPGPNSL